MHTACLAADGAEREGEVALLTIPGAVGRKEEVVGEGRVAPPQRTLEHRSDDVPDVEPALASGSPQGTRVLAGAEYRTVGVVVERDQLRPPPDHHRDRGAEAEAECAPQGGRPAFDGAERRRRPVDGAHERRRLARKQAPELGALGRLGVRESPSLLARPGRPPFPHWTATCFRAPVYEPAVPRAPPAPRIGAGTSSGFRALRRAISRAVSSLSSGRFRGRKSITTPRRRPDRCFHVRTP